MNNNSIGTIYRGEEELYELEGINNGFRRVISIETGRPQTLLVPNKFNQFFKEIKGLERIANIFLECILKPFSHHRQIRYLSNKIRVINP